jgi:hypothetical protein
MQTGMLLAVIDICRHLCSCVRNRATWSCIIHLWRIGIDLNSDLVVLVSTRRRLRHILRVCNAQFALGRLEMCGPNAPAHH